MGAVGDEMEDRRGVRAPEKWETEGAAKWWPPPLLSPQKAERGGERTGG